MLHKDIIQEIFQYIPPLYHINFRLVNKTFNLVYKQNINKIEWWYPDKDRYKHFLVKLGKNEDLYHFKKEVKNPHFYDVFIFISNSGKN